MAGFANATELAQHFRKRLAHEGIKARCRVLLGSKTAIQVFVPKHGMEFTQDDQRKIRFIAHVNGLTGVRGLPIDVDRMTDPHSMEFHLPA